MSVTSFLNSKDLFNFEGHTHQDSQQGKDLILLTNKPNLNVMEIGFNAGHSAELFLQNNVDLTLTSFDLGTHEYVSAAKEYMDATYPNRHTLILGDSTVTIPKFIDENTNTKFDVIFIDGCHDYSVAQADLDNCFLLSHSDTIIILDDTMFTIDWEAPWTRGPSRTWTEHLSENKIIELNTTDYSYGRGMSWGKYINFSANEIITL